MMVSLPAPASIVNWTTPALSPDASIVSLPPSALITSLIVGAFRAGDIHLPRQPIDAERCPVADHGDDVLGVAAVDDDGVGRAVTATDAVAQVEVDLLHAGADEVVHRDRVGAAPCDEVDVLDAVEVHRDVADIAGEAHAAAVRGDLDLLVDVRAVELQRVVAGLAFDRVAAVARVPHEGIVAGAEERYVVAAAAVDEVVAVAANQGVVAVAAGDRVVARAAIDREVDQAGEAVAGGDDVIAAIGIHHQVLSGADIDG